MHGGLGGRPEEVGRTRLSRALNSPKELTLLLQKGWVGRE